MAGRLLVEAGWVITVDPGDRVIRNGAVLIEDGRILAVGRSDEMDVGAAEVARFPRHAVIPGLVNAHTHVVGSLFRGLLEDRVEAFYGFALPTERFLDPEASYILSRLGIAELQLAGCTVINDMFHFPAETLRAALEAGLRAQVANKVFDTDLTIIGRGQRSTDLSRGQQKLADNVALYDDWNGRGEGRLEVRFGAHAADTCSPELLAGIREEAGRRGAGIHTHVAQSAVERDYVAETYNCGSVELLERHGILGAKTIAVHLIFADRLGIDLLSRTGTGVAHCPAGVANHGLFGPLREIYEAGIRVGWGTDWARMDPWDAMRFGIAGLRLVHDEDLLLSARDALRRLTMGSAEILGWQGQVGSLEPGKNADLTFVDCDQPHLSPLYDPVSVLVYNAGRRDVTDVMVGGEFVVQGGEVTWADRHELVSSAQAAAERIWAQAGLAVS
jgi:5-methylthioadenosine/S-adenosylhomocysteine deaminase